MANIHTLDPSASPLDYYGWELRRQREAACLKQGQLGEIIFCTGSLIGQIETTKKLPTRDFSERVDAALGTGGMFSRLIGLVLRSQLPAWFQPYADMEAKATYISTYQAQVVYGLLQTEEYARALLATGMPDDLENQVAARIERQRILERERPPFAWARSRYWWARLFNCRQFTMEPTLLMTVCGRRRQAGSGFHRTRMRSGM